MSFLNYKIYKKEMLNDIINLESINSKSTKILEIFGIHIIKNYF